MLAINVAQCRHGAAYDGELATRRRLRTCGLLQPAQALRMRKSSRPLKNETRFGTQIAFWLTVVLNLLFAKKKGG